MFGSFTVLSRRTIANSMFACYRYKNGDRGGSGHREEGTAYASPARVQVAGGDCNPVLRLRDSLLAVVSGQGPRGERRGPDPRRTSPVQDRSGFLSGEFNLHPEPADARREDSEGVGGDPEGEGGRGGCQRDTPGRHIHHRFHPVGFELLHPLPQVRSDAVHLQGE